MKTLETPVVAENTVAETKSTNTGVKGMTNFDKLSEDNQKSVRELVDALINGVKKDGKTDYTLIMGALDLINAEKKAAKVDYDALATERKAAAKELAEANAAKLHDVMAVGDTVSYLLKSQKAVFVDVKVQKITDKRFHVELDEDTKAIVDGKETVAGKIPTLSLGKKYVAFDAIKKINGMEPAEYLAKMNEAKKIAVAKAN